MQADAYAKVNLGLQVRAPGPDGYHPIRSLAVSVDWADRLRLEPADEDAFEVDGPAPSGPDNLAWRAVAAVRTSASASASVRLHLTKRIAVAAGLGGGSADAAAALRLGARLFGGETDLDELAAELGADVTFCLSGGFALLEGRGERVTPMGPTPADFALGIVVPPVELSTATVYRVWDRADGPAGPAPPAGALPPSLRRFAPLPNDLYPAAVRLAPQLDEWRAELAARWDRPVAMSGSGPALFAYFLDVEEARAALPLAPSGARADRAAVPVAQGSTITGGTLP